VKPSPSITRVYRSRAVHAGARIRAIPRELIEVAEAWLAQEETCRRKARNYGSGRGLRRAHGEPGGPLGPRAVSGGIAPTFYSKVPRTLAIGMPAYSTALVGLSQGWRTGTCLVLPSQGTHPPATFAPKLATVQTATASTGIEQAPTHPM
jgi:hypothetical protein